MNNELRLCLIEFEKMIERGKAPKKIITRGYFHRWEEISHIVPPSHVMGGHNGGVEQRVLAIVELEDGTVREVYPTQIRFISQAEWLEAGK